MVKQGIRSGRSSTDRLNQIFWDGKDVFGDQLAKGVYIYRVKVKDVNGQTAEKTEKLVILK